MNSLPLPDAHRRHQRLLALASVLLLTAVAHWPVLHAQAVSIDDDQFVNQNPLVTHPSWHSAARFFSEVSKPSTVPGYYIPLSMTSLMLDVAAGGRPGDWYVFHRTNLVLHLLVTALVVLLLEGLFGALLPAALVGLAFGLHPLTVEPVAWVSERKTLLSTLFAFASLACYVRAARGGTRTWFVAAVALFVPALLSKPTVAPLPLLLLALDGWPLGRLSTRAAVEKWPFALLAIASSVVTLLSHERTAGIAASSLGEAASWPIRAGYLLGFYLAKVVHPVGLSCIYDMPQPFAFSNPVVAVAVLAVAALTIGVIALGRRTPAPLVGWLVFVLAIAPTLGLVKYSWVVASDKYVYFPAIGLLLVLAALLVRLWRAPLPGRVAVALLMIALLCAEAYGTRAALVPWRDSLSLWVHMERITPDSPVIENRLGLLIGRSNEAEALRHFERAVGLHVEFPDAEHNYGITLADAGRLAEAIPHLRRAVELEPTNASSASHLGSALVASGQVAEGLSWLKHAELLAPDDAETQLHLALALLATPGHAADAVAHLRRAITLRPGDVTAINELAWVLATTPEVSVRDASAALELAGRATTMTARRNASVLDTEAAALAAAGRFDEATSTAAEALRLAAADTTLAPAIRARLELYRRGRPYLEPGRAGRAR